MFNHLCLQGKMHICHIYLACSSKVSIFIPACGRYIWKFSQLALNSVKILVTHWQFVGCNQNFDFCSSCQSNLFLVHGSCRLIAKFCLWPCFVQKFMVSCVAKWEISTISLTVWHVGYQSHGILGNFDIFPTKSAIS